MAISARKRDPIKVYRLVLTMLFVVVCLSFLVLAFLQRNSEVDIELKLNQFSILVSDTRIADLFNSVGAVSLNLTNFERVNLGRGTLEICGPSNYQRKDCRPAGIGKDLESTVSAKTPLASLHFEAVTLNQIGITVGSRVIISSIDDDSNSVKLTLDKEPTGQIGAGRTLHFTCNDCEIGSVPVSNTSAFLLTSRLSDGQLIAFYGRPRNESTILVMELPMGRVLREQDIKIETIRDCCNRLDRGRLTSTIIKGKVKFAEAEEPEITLGAGDFVSAEALDNFLIKTIELNKGINLSLHGRVRALATGSDAAHMKNRLPSVLRWITNRKPWMLWLNASIGAFSLLLKGLDRLKVFPRGQ